MTRRTARRRRRRSRRRRRRRRRRLRHQLALRAGVSRCLLLRDSRCRHRCACGVTSRQARGNVAMRTGDGGGGGRRRLRWRRRRRRVRVAHHVHPHGNGVGETAVKQCRTKLLGNTLQQQSEPRSSLSSLLDSREQKPQRKLHSKKAITKPRHHASVAGSSRTGHGNVACGCIASLIAHCPTYGHAGSRDASRESGDNASDSATPRVGDAARSPAAAAPPPPLRPAEYEEPLESMS